MTSIRLDWRGPRIASRAEQATKDGIDQTTATCVTVAQGLAPVDTGFYKNTLEFSEARREGKRIVGRWGNATADYAIWIEIGARGRPGQYVLRRAADREYPKLHERIKAALR